MIEKINSYIDSKNKNILFCFFALLAIAIRMLCSLRGHSLDFETLDMSATAALKGENFYTEIPKISNYAPIGYFILGGIKSLCFNFRYEMSLFLSLIDVLIAFLVFTRKNYFASLFFLFSPISIIISGYHCQIDNLAILFALLAVFYVGRNKKIENMSIKETFVFSAIIGLSLVTKHIFIFFPIWMFFKTNKINQKLIFIIVPFSMFLLSFVPFLPNGGYESIKQNVFNYPSFNNAPFYNAFINSTLINKIISLINMTEFAPRLFFFVAVIICGICFRKRNIFESFLFYLLCIFVFSSAITNQYLVIPLLFTAFYPNIYSILFNIWGLLFLTFDWCELHYTFASKSFNQKITDMIIDRYGYGYYIFVLLLLFSLIHALYKNEIKQLIKNCYNECLEAIKFKN
ncbi:MAG: hypothetical protein WC223_04265 [Bacteroidales bacterium]